MGGFDPIFLKIGLHFKMNSMQFTACRYQRVGNFFHSGSFQTNFHQNNVIKKDTFIKGALIIVLSKVWFSVRHFV